MAKAKPVWIEVPAKVVVKEGERGRVVELKVSLCFDPPMEVSPHPIEVGVSMLTTGFGTKQVVMGYEALLAKLQS